MLPLVVCHRPRLRRMTRQATNAAISTVTAMIASDQRRRRQLTAVPLVMTEAYASGTPRQGLEQAPGLAEALVQAAASTISGSRPCLARAQCLRRRALAGPRAQASHAASESDTPPQHGAPPGSGRGALLRFGWGLPGVERAARVQLPRVGADRLGQDSDDDGGHEGDEEFHVRIVPLGLEKSNRM